MKQIKFHEKIEKFSFVSLAFPPVVFTWLPSSHLGSRRNLNLAEMEAKEEKEKERNSGKRKRRGFSPSHSDGNTVIFPLLLAAALSRSNTHTTLVKKCLTKFLSHGQPIPTPFLSLCPLLLNSKSPQIAILTARILGAASLMSFQMNQQVVSDSPTLKALISLMPPSHKNMIVSMAACDALLDLCSTCVARHRLLHFSALETLMFAFLQVRRSSILISLGTGDDVNIASLRIVFQRDGLASVFGQPSAGANLYLTPPNSQGLARHYDDHCVFVCQIFGSKQWKIFSQPNVQLPRLYDPCNIQNGEGIDNSRADCYHFLLNEGDVLYIPRGFPHEACTHYSSPDGSAGLSLHLTLGIEVEPPFEWEGFMQVALFYWNHTQHQHHLSLKSLSGILNAMSVKLLHIVIGLISDSDPTFRKACLVAAASLESDANNWLDLCQKTIFSNLIEKINRESRFLEALKSVEVAIQRNEDPFQRIRWLRSLNQEGESVEGCEWVVAPSGVQDIFRLYVEYKEMAETVFMEVKSKFCSQVSYDHVTTVYRILHEKYKKARKQYMNGMHSLHYV
ncbi:bifunctional lysine-specific demethylase and histidyl-hydroxylase NO66-like isoform X5 [Durio zibethinus]|uniref:Bifunctional lysine-specific demethylase and histidyl-hydroxylase n=1 Tax=Durio zibethinus TaxID=66656 RepID=A0A6P5WR51_DURZI|nr:bifunctional lysine-specific demethylase and histidyl-hydroxylase NO66-like isoform X5 [Durio zibethinus]